MTAHELADLIGLCGDGGYNQDAADMLRQQADRIVALEQKHKDAFDYIEKLLKERQLWMICIFTYLGRKILSIPLTLRT